MRVDNDFTMTSDVDFPGSTGVCAQLLKRNFVFVSWRKSAKASEDVLVLLADRTASAMLTSSSFEFRTVEMLRNGCLEAFSTNVTTDEMVPMDGCMLICRWQHDFVLVAFEIPFKEGLGFMPVVGLDFDQNSSTLCVCWLRSLETVR